VGNFIGMVDGLAKEVEDEKMKVCMPMARSKVQACASCYAVIIILHSVFAAATITTTN
jgi:hypothetical protein